MLTIHTPIELTADPSILRLNSNFTERLTGNYKLIGNGLEAEDMLHFLSQPPEIYLAEGGMTSLADYRNLYENRNLKLDVINNVLNRILVSDTYRTTYQDQVFIESVLKKIGVTDVREFMHQVQNIRQEIKNRNLLTDLYWSGREIFSRLREYRLTQIREKPQEMEPEKERDEETPLYLHQTIMNRLQTGVIYQELFEYLSSSADHRQAISYEEMQISEQVATAQNILLNKLRNYTTAEEQPLVYHYLNIYEMGDEIGVREDRTATVNRIIRAALFNALYQMYALRSEELTRQENVWYQLAGAVFQTMENTVQRFADYQEQHFLTVKEADEYGRLIRQYQNNEIRAVERYVTESRFAEGSRIEAAGNAGENKAELLYAEVSSQEAPGEGRTELLLQTIRKLRLHGQQIRLLTKQENLLRQRLEQTNRNSVSHSQLLQRITAQGGRGDKDRSAAPERIEAERGGGESGAALLYRETFLQEEAPGEGGNSPQVRQIQKTELHGQQILSLTKQETLLRQQLEQINEKNVHNAQLLQRLIRQDERGEENGRINKAKAKEDALRVLTQPEEVLLTYLESGTDRERRETTERENLIRVFGEETVRIFETIEKYRKTPALATASRAVTPDAESMLLRDVRMQETENQTELIRQTKELAQETVHEIETKRLLREYMPERQTQIRMETQTHTERMELVHRQQENTLEEEMLEEIRGLNRTARIENVQTKEQTLIRNTTQEIINSRVNEFQVQQNEELARMISEKVQRQLGNLSEQVYGKLEKRMDTERRRRGL